MSPLRGVCWKFLNPIFDFLVTGFNVENWIRKSRLKELPLLVEKNSLVLGKGFKYAVDNVTLIETIGHVNSSFNYAADILFRETREYFGRVEVLDSLAFLLLFGLFVNFALLLYFDGFEFLEDSLDFVSKRTVLGFDLLYQIFYP